jgi:hypothetical protein
MGDYNDLVLDIEIRLNSISDYLQSLGAATFDEADGIIDARDEQLSGDETVAESPDLLEEPPRRRVRFDDDIVVIGGPDEIALEPQRLNYDSDATVEDFTPGYARVYEWESDSDTDTVTGELVDGYLEPVYHLD